MPQLPYTDRWRDETFLTLHERWATARRAWGKLRLGLACVKAGTKPYNPDPTALPEGSPERAAAMEYHEARNAYLDDVAARLKAEGPEESGAVDAHHGTS